MARRCAAAVIAGVIGCLAAPAHADPRAEIAAKAKAAMASYDTMDYDAAKRQLHQALAIAKRARLDDDPIVARVYLDLAIAQLAASDREAAKLALLSAAQIDPDIAIDAAYRSPELVKMLDEAKAAVATADAGAIETEDPLDAPDATARPAPGAPGPPGRAPRMTLAIAGGTGLGYVTGRTEYNYQVRTCCIGSSPIVVAAELGYQVTRQLSLGVAMRLGFPIGADIEGHSTLAPAGLLRARYALSGSGDGLRVMAQLGGGVLRNTIELDDTADAMGTDIVAQGPLLVGAGIGYTRRLGNRLIVFADLDAIAGIAVTDELGSAIHLNSGLSADMSLGLAVGF